MMKPGPELDALVAEKVFGEPVIKDGLGYIFRDQLEFEGEYLQVPSFSTSIAHAWEVVEVIAKDYEIHIQLNSFDPKWRCYISSHNKEPLGRLADHSEDTAPHAICLASLKAIGYNINATTK